MTRIALIAFTVAFGASGATELRAPDGSWALRLEPAQPHIVHLGMDSEGTGRETRNLLKSPAALTLDNARLDAPVVNFESGNDRAAYTLGWGGGTIRWDIRRAGASLSWIIDWRTRQAPRTLGFVIPFDPSVTPACVLPHAIDGASEMAPPWLLVAPDHGHLLAGASAGHTWRAVLRGTRRPNRKGALDLWLECQDCTTTEGSASLTFTRPEIAPPPKFADLETWKKIRRSWLNLFQPASSWSSSQPGLLLANNSLSDPAGISFHYYSAAIRVHPVPVEGIDLRLLLRRSLDYWLARKVRGLGNVAAFGDYDLYVETNANLVVSAWDYWKASGDREWLAKQAPRLHHVADFLTRRDQNGDGLTESINSGNRYTLRDPDRADAWWEMVNFGGTNAWTNAQTYRAYLCMAEMLEAVGESNGARYYWKLAGRVRDRFVPAFYNPSTGWLAGWISQDGQMHDYCHVNVVGRAVAYGLVDQERARTMMERVVRKSHSIGFGAWELGVPMNLIPVRREDMIQPRRLIDGSVGRDDWALSDDGTASFGKVAYNGILSPAQTYFYVLGLQAAGFRTESDRILNAMLTTLQAGGLQNGVVNEGYMGAEHRRWDGGTAGYEGYLADNYVITLAYLGRSEEFLRTLLEPRQPK